MTTQALYNRWRGQTFDDILGQEHITQTLRNQIRAGRIGHAYLFTGLRGTGKTSTARILAKAVNCIGDVDDPPCNKCHICRAITSGASLDLIEIDAASNRGIDEIRELRERVAFSPSEARYKVYVIDEVHMLTKEAFNALLKTLEEPPPHVIFVLCTTEPHRLPDTILSRCQRFDFRRAAVPVVMQKLERICLQEGINIAPDALEFVARKGAGSFRDAESLLDQLAAYGSDSISLDLVHRVLGAVEARVLTDIVGGLVTGDIAAGLKAINEAIDRGADPRQFLGEILDSLRAVLLLRVGGNEELLNLGPEGLKEMRRVADVDAVSLPQLVRAIKRFGEAGQAMRYSSRPQIPFELAFVEAALDISGVGEERSPGGTPASERGAKIRAETKEAGMDSRTPSIEPQADSKAKGSEGPAIAGADSGQQVQATPVAAGVQGSESDQEAGHLSIEQVRGHWNLVLSELKPHSEQVRALLNSARPISVEGNVVTLGCEAAFHRDKLRGSKKRALVEKVLSQVLGVETRINCVVDNQIRQAPKAGESLQPQSAGRTVAPTSPSQTPSGDNAVDERQQLLNHPAVKELEKRGGVVSQVSVQGDQETGG